MAKRETRKILMLALLATFVPLDVSSEERITSKISEEAAARYHIPWCLSQGTQCARAGGFCYYGECPKDSIHVGKGKPSGLCGDSRTHCVCCKPQDLCGTQNKCAALGGRCSDMTRFRCYWKYLQGKEFCKGKNCGCCAPPDLCGTQNKCVALGGRCFEMTRARCYGKYLQGKQYCKGKNCGCCAPFVRTSFAQLMATEEQESLE